MRIAVVANPTARGGSRRRRARTASERLGSAADLTVHTPHTRADADDVFAALVDTRPDAIVVSGGDGTVRVAVQHLAGTGIPLAILPDGTGNDLAASVGVVAAEDVVATVAAGRTRRIDVGVVTRTDGTVERFASVLASGFDSLVNDRANRMRLLRGGARYDLAIAVEFLRLRRIDYRLSWRTADGGTGEHDGPLMMATVANTRQYGGGIRIAPHAVDDDGALDLVLVDPGTRLSLLPLLGRVLRGRHLGAPGVRTERVLEVRIESPGLRAYADGDPIAELPATVRVEPGALTLLSV